MSNPHIPSNGQGNLANLMGVMGVAQAISFPTKKQSNFQENSVEKDRVQNTKSKSLSLRRASSQGLQSKYLSTKQPEYLPQHQHQQHQQHQQPRSRGARETKRTAPSPKSDASIQVVSSRLGSANIKSFSDGEAKSLQSEAHRAVENYKARQVDSSYLCDLSEESGVRSLSLMTNEKQIYFAEFVVRTNLTEPLILKFNQKIFSIKNLTDLPSNFVLSEDGKFSISRIDQNTGLKIEKNQAGLFAYGFCSVKDRSFIDGCVVNENSQIQYNSTAIESPLTTSAIEFPLTTSNQTTSASPSTSQTITSSAPVTSASPVHYYSCNSTENGFEIFDEAYHDVVNFSLTTGLANAVFYESKLSFNDRKEFTLIGLDNSYNFDRFGNTSSRGVTLLNSSDDSKIYQIVVADKIYNLVFDLKGSEVENATIIDQNGVGIKFKVDAKSILSSEAIIDRKSVTNCSAFQVPSSPISYYQNCSTFLNSGNATMAQSIEIKSSSESKYEVKYIVNKRFDQNQNLSFSVDFNGTYQNLSIDPRLTMQDNFNLISNSFNRSGFSSGLNVKFENNSIIFSDKFENDPLNPFGIKLSLTKKENGLFEFQYINGDNSCPLLSEGDDVLKSYTTAIAFNPSTTVPLTTKFITSSARPTTSSTPQATTSSARPTTSSTPQATTSSARPTTSSTPQATTSSSEVFTTSTPYQISSAPIIIPTNTSGPFCNITNGKITFFENSDRSDASKLTVKFVPDPSRISYTKSCEISKGSDKLVFNDRYFTFNGVEVSIFPRELMIDGKKYNIKKTIEQDQTKYLIIQNNLELSVQYHKNGKINFEAKNQDNLISQCNYNEQGIVTSSSSTSGVGITTYSTPEGTNTVAVSPDGATATISTTTSPTSPIESISINIPKFLNGFEDYCRDFLKGANPSGYSLNNHLTNIIDIGIKNGNITFSNSNSLNASDNYIASPQDLDKLTEYLNKILNDDKGESKNKTDIKDLIDTLEKCPRDSKVDIGAIIGAVICIVVLFAVVSYCVKKKSQIDRKNNVAAVGPYGGSNSPASSVSSDQVFVRDEGSSSEGMTRDGARNPSPPPSLGVVHTGAYSLSSHSRNGSFIRTNSI